MKFTAAIAILLCSSLFAQADKGRIQVPRDTSFTLWSTWQKLKGEYSGISPVMPKLPDNVSAHENLVYCKVGGRELHLDLFVPKERTPAAFPAVLLIHGGGWRSGDRTMEFPMAQFLAARGYVAATVEYRLSPEAKYPAGVYDLKSAIRWLRAHARRWRIDPGLIAVYGCSAGGQLAALLGTTGDNPAFEGNTCNPGQSTAVQAVVDLDGILDFTDPAESGKDTGSAPPSAGKAWFGASYNEKPGVWKEASALNHVSSRSAPMLFVNSALPRFHAGRDAVIEKLKSFNIYSEVHTIPNTPHPFWLFHPWFDDASTCIVHFLDRVVKKAQGSP